MINNNTTINTNVNTGTTSQSTPYLKKSELPKVVSAFDNDKGYLTTSTLETWLMKHSYIPKSDIEKIVSASKDQIIEIVDNSAGGEAVGKLEGYIEGNKKEIVEIKDRLNNLDKNVGNLQTESKSYLTQHQDLSSYAKLTQIDTINEQLKSVDSRLSDLDAKTFTLETFGQKNYLTEQSLDGYATEDWVKKQKYLTSHQSLKDYATQSWVKEQGFLTENPDLSSYATQEWVESKGYLTSHQNLSSYASKSWVEGKGYLTEHQNLADYASKSWVEDQGFLTEHQDLSSYAKKTDLNSANTKIKSLETKQNSILKQIPELATVSSLTDYVQTDTINQTLKDYVKNTTLTSQLNGYVKNSVLTSTLKNYATKSSVYTKNNINTLLTDYLKVKDAKDTYVPRNEIEDTYITIKDATNTFLTIEDYRGLKDATTINTQYKEKQIEDLKQDLAKDINLAMNGFYIVNKSDVVIVKDKEIINIFKDGVPQANLVWTEE